MAPIFTGSRFGFGRSAEAAAAVPVIKASGGNQTPSNGLAPGNGYTYHTFTATGPNTFTVLSSSLTSVELLMVAGGGGGGEGGGGAGAVIYRTSVPVSSTPGVYPMTVGTPGPVALTHNDGPNMLGGPSTAFGFTAGGGGWGGNHTFSGPSVAGGPGGSGGGGAPLNGGGAPYPGGGATGASGGSAGAESPPVGWGNAGAPTQGGNAGPGGGGGGAGGGAGGVSGGSGLNYPNFTGPLVGAPLLPGTYGVGGGGNGAGARTATANTGMGGQAYNPGGSGVIIIRYQ